MNRGFLIGLFLITLASGVLASCGDPRLTIEVSSPKTFQGGQFDMNLTMSANPPPLATCICLSGHDCGFKWQYFKDGNWTQIPSTQAFDLNCSGSTCSTGTGFPVEDREYSKSISCAELDGYRVRGYIPSINKSTDPVTIYCYQSLACIPPATGSFFLDQMCTYKNTPLWIDQNFHILSSGHAINQNSDVNFFSAGSHFLKIKNGGQIDLNHSMIFAGITQVGEIGILGGLLMFLLLFVFGLTINFRRAMV